MPRPVSIPQYQLHRPSGQARVGKQYLGVHGTRESWLAYDLIVGPMVIERMSKSDERDRARLTVSDILAAFWASENRRLQARGARYVGVRLAEWRRIIDYLRRECTGMLAKDFSPAVCRRIREKMCCEVVQRAKITRAARRLWSRQYIIRVMETVRFIFKWAAGRELVPPNVSHALQEMIRMEPTRQVRETRRTLPAPESVVAAALAHAAPMIAAMVRIQLLTGMRPGEICSLRACDIRPYAEGNVWIFEPTQHKTQHVGKARPIMIGPKAQKLLMEQMRGVPVRHYVFTGSRLRHETIVFKRNGAPRPCCWRNRQPSYRRKAERTRTVRDAKRLRKIEDAPALDPHNYMMAIRRACEKAFPLPTGLNASTKEGSDWLRAHRFAPHQLRHAFATQCRAKFGLDLTRQMLGHESATMTEVYAEYDLAGIGRLATTIG